MTLKMIKKMVKKAALLAAFLMLTIIPTADAAGPASLAFGSVTLRNGCPATIPININTGGEDIWAADVSMQLGGSASIDSLTLGSVLPFQACNDPSEPSFMLCGARQPGTDAYNGQGVYGNIAITPTAAGSLSLSFNESGTNIINDDIQNVLGTTTGRTYTVASRYNTEVDGVGFCDPDTTAPTILVSPSNGKNNVPLDTSIQLTLSDDRVGVDISTLTFSVQGVAVSTAGFTASGGTYTPPTPFDLGERVEIKASVCDLESNCRNYSSSFRTTPPAPPPQCGDGQVGEGEECDDGYQTASCDRDCTLVECGDGIINDIAGEQCDDFNTESGDGCSAICAIETPVEDETYCPVVEEIQECEDCEECEICPELPEEPEPEPEDEIEPPEPEIEYTNEEIEEKAVQVVEEEEAAEETPASIEIPEQEEEVISQIDECKLAYPSLDFESDSADADDDGLSNKTECYGLTDPLLADTDGDGCNDGDEINQYATSPADGFDCQPEVKKISISSPQAGWLIAELEISGLTHKDTSLVHLLAFPATKRTFEFNNETRKDGIELGTVKKFNLSGVENQYHFRYKTDVRLDDGEAYNVVAIGVLRNGETISSPPIRITMDSQSAAIVPQPTSIGGVPITGTASMERLKIKPSDDGKVRVTGKTEYGSQVFAVWESLVLASSVIADSKQGEFAIESPRALEVGQDHEVTLFALKKAGDQKIKSKNVDIQFHISKPSNAPYVVGGAVAASSAFLFFALKRRKKRRR